MVKLSLKINSIIDFYYNSKKSLFIFLLLLIGVMIPSFSGNVPSNIWLRFNYILSSKIFNYFISIASFIFVLNYLEKSNNYFFIVRFNNKKKILLKNIKEVIICSLYFCILSILLVLSGAIVFCKGNFEIIIYEKFNISIIYYLIFKIIYFLIYYIGYNLIFYLLILSKKNNYYIICCILFINAFIYFIFNDNVNLYFNSFWVLFPQLMLIFDLFSTFDLSILFFFFESIILLFIIIYLYYKNAKNMGDYL